jgi:hypothetical protein
MTENSSSRTPFYPLAGQFAVFSDKGKLKIRSTSYPAHPQLEHFPEQDQWIRNFSKRYNHNPIADLVDLTGVPSSMFPLILSASMSLVWVESAEMPWYSYINKYFYISNVNL